ncbi:MAG: flagellar basal body L-ring protein FlgH [Gammaproteobacteria bacterium]|jgi:flagellar L-ring protein FlgH
MNSKGIILILIVSVLAGCNSAPKRDPEYAAVRPVYTQKPVATNGAIYQRGHEISWFEDMRARRVGDLLTVKLVEKTEGSKESNSEIKKSQSLSVANPTLFGSSPQFGVPGIVPLASNSNNTLATSLESDSAFKGEGDADQSNELSGSVTVTVVEVLPNGYLYVRGEKRIGINQGNEYVKLSGIVRPADIDSTNSVESTRIGDATIQYVGDGQVADASAMGWLAKFFISAIMPF